MNVSDAADPLSGALRDEARALIGSTGLEAVLKDRFGDCAVVGSVALDLMTWRDIDICAPVPRAGLAQFLGALPPLHAAFADCGCAVLRAAFNDEWAEPRGTYGSGYYWGLRVRTDGRTLWKVDLWGWDPQTYARKLREHEQLRRSLAGVDRRLVLRLKRAAQEMPGFRDAITSWDVYRFVLRREGTSPGQLLSFAQRERAAGR